MKTANVSKITNLEMMNKANALGKLIMIRYHILRSDPIFTHAMLPVIYDLILFGSTAAGKENPGDLDLMVVDDGRIGRNQFRKTSYGYTQLVEVFASFCNMLDIEFPDLVSSGCNVKTDLKLLHKHFFERLAVRNVAKSVEVDQMFYNNAFSKAMRFDHNLQQFVPFTLEQFEQRYCTTLTDLRQ